MTTYTHTSTGETIHTITGRRQYLSALSLGLTGNETPADLAALGFAPYTPPPAEPPEPPPARYSKLAILRALAGLDQRETFLDWLDSDRGLRAEWDAAQYIAADDPTFGQALQTFVAAVSLSESEAEAILSECVL